VLMGIAGDDRSALPTMEEMTKLFKGLDERIINTLLSAASLRRMKKGETLIHQGELPERFDILLHGVMRGVVFDSTGRDITSCLICRRGDFALGANDFSQLSLMSIEALTDVQLLELPLRLVAELIESEPQMTAYRARALDSAMVREWNIKMMLYSGSAMERYRWFLENYPGLIDVISNKYIASFLGISPVTLSRMRSKHRDEKTAGGVILMTSETYQPAADIDAEAETK
ncbi:MAG: cyclic nucleotide-binding domain-containing protein, partial [Oscillospiraceae bacterium]|nr:cyclic nucleotide-binding domain-containing protein [Oscillospiraceae bacterium]